MNIKDVVAGKAIKARKIDMALSIISFIGVIGIIIPGGFGLMYYFNPVNVGWVMATVKCILVAIMAFLWIRFIFWMQEKNIKALIQFEKDNNCYLLINPRCYIRKPGCWFNITDSKMEQVFNGENSYVFYFQPFAGETCMKYSINASTYEAFNKTFEDASKKTIRGRGYSSDTIVFVDDNSLFEGEEEITTVKASLGFE